MLSRLFARNSLNVLGINSGTSIDGLDLALVKVSRTKSGELRVKPLLKRAAHYPASVRKALLHLADSAKVAPEELALLDEALGDLIGEAARSFIASAKRKDLRTETIASHGQTIRHHPLKVSRLGRNICATLQIGAPERIASQTGLPVVSNFRQADTALGGEGAPITTSAVYHVLHSSRKSRLVINIGGIANIFYIKKGGPLSLMEARDVGPGNVLLDLAAQELFSADYDRGGKLAASGAVSLRLLSLMSGGGFFKGAETRSTGRERYTPASLRKILKLARDLELSAEDILASLVELSASKIISAAERIAGGDKHLKEVYLSGGGLKNRQLVRRIRAGLPSLKVYSIKKLGYHPDFFESVCYAILGYCCLHGLEAIQPASSRGAGIGQKSNIRVSAPILGRISQPPKLIHHGTLARNR
ncbi:MAG: anhydro-N-acetylmuramic acid kinase [candidate division Zixibacteria bacterium]|nr:anhydro-N-acetylmuramic acid kinase [candidate division Zixibacteria bacterium]